MRIIRRQLWRIGLVGGFVLVAGVVAASAGAVPPPTVSTVVTGLDNPRDLDLGPGGLYVAEAGHGGPNCFTGPDGTTCVGFTSQISRIDVQAHTFHPVVTGLVSVSDETGGGATGVDGISFLNGSVHGIITGSADSVPDSLPGISDSVVAAAKRQLGQLIVADPWSGYVRLVADVGDADYQWTGDRPDLVPGQFPDANPYAVLALPGEDWVIDAGSNTLDDVRTGARWSSVGVEVFFPNPASADAVPTCIDRGPDGALYIGELTGEGNPPGSAVVWRYTRDGGLTEWASGLTTVTGCGFGADGHFYAVEFSTDGLDGPPGTGALVEVPAHSTSPNVVADGFSFPGGFAAGPDGSVYFSNWSVAPAVSGMGSVVKVSNP